MVGFNLIEITVQSTGSGVKTLDFFFIFGEGCTFVEILFFIFFTPTGMSVSVSVCLSMPFANDFY